MCVCMGGRQRLSEAPVLALAPSPALLTPKAGADRDKAIPSCAGDRLVWHQQ